MCDLTRQNHLVNFIFCQGYRLTFVFYVFFVSSTNVCLYSAIQKNNVTRSLQYTLNVYVIPFLFGYDKSIFANQPSKRDAKIVLRTRQWAYQLLLGPANFWVQCDQGQQKCQINKVAELKENRAENAIEFLLRLLAIRFSV